ncbi:DUF4959 domain-containing protein [Lacibacter sp. H375]|uniref:DUF4959 domain-containing protein n=1 Tax=Lacibacter sp. H375 TaxID=3133424 RepID=UPI0030C135E4
MKLIKIIVPSLLLTAFIVASCSKELETHTPISNDPTVPAQITGVTVLNGAGKATISYKLPNDPNLLYVKAVYTITTGKQYETTASYYNNSLVVEGFADTLEHEVKLYSVSRSEVQSPAVTVKIKPLTAPIWDVFRSLKIEDAFGGYNLTGVNASKANISIIVTKPNVFKEYEIDNNKTVYTNVDSILSKIRGLDTGNYRFGFLVVDRWGNKTDTMYKIVNPIFETQLDPSKFSSLVLPGDAPQVTNGAALQYAWDGKLGWPFTSFTNQVPGGSGPHMITFNTGALAKLSRIWIRPFPEGTRFYYLTTMKRFEIYGSDNPNLNGALDNSWKLLGSYTVKKPSGLPYGTDDANDQTTAAAGFSWEIDLSAPKVKYIRIRCLENFAGGTAQSINELKVYGDPR